MHVSLGVCENNKIKSHDEVLSTIYRCRWKQSLPREVSGYKSQLSFSKSLNGIGYTGYDDQIILLKRVTDSKVRQNYYISFKQWGTYIDSYLQHFQYHVSHK